MDGRQAFELAGGAANGFTVNCHHLPSRGPGYLPRQMAEATAKFVRINGGKHPVDGIMRGHPMLKATKLLKPFKLAVAKFFDFVPVVCSAQDGRNDQQENIEQRVLKVAL